MAPATADYKRAASLASPHHPSHCAPCLRVTPAPAAMATATIAEAGILSTPLN